MSQTINPHVTRSRTRFATLAPVIQHPILPVMSEDEITPTPNRVPLPFSPHNNPTQLRSSTGPGSASQRLPQGMPPGGPPGDGGDGGDDGDDGDDDDQGDQVPEEEQEVSNLLAGPPDPLIDALNSITAFMARPPATPRRTIKPRDPDPFDGSDPRKLNTFLLQLQFYFQNCSSAFRDDFAKVSFALSYLKGTALEFFEPQLLEVPDLRLIPWLSEYTLFVVELRSNFGTIDPEGDAEDQMDLLVMKDNTKILNYNVAFQKLQVRLTWSDSALRHCYYRGLPRRIKDIISLQGKPTTLALMRRAAQFADARYWEREREKGREDRSSPAKSTSAASGERKPNPPTPSSSSSYTPSPSQSSSSSKKTSNASSSTPAKNPLVSVLGSDGKLLPAEQARRLENKLCLFCGTAGHQARDCPKPQSSASQAKGRSAGLAVPSVSGSESSPEN